MVITEFGNMQCIIYSRYDSHYYRLILLGTVLGKSLITKCGAIATLVEDVLISSDRSGQQPSITAICHAGADLMLRTAYCPDKFSHRVALLDGANLLNVRRESTGYVCILVYVYVWRYVMW